MTFTVSPMFVFRLAVAHSASPHGEGGRTAEMEATAPDGILQPPPEGAFEFWYSRGGKKSRARRGGPLRAPANQLRGAKPEGTFMIETTLSKRPSAGLPSRTMEADMAPLLHGPLPPPRLLPALALAIAALSRPPAAPPRRSTGVTTRSESATPS